MKAFQFTNIMNLLPFIIYSIMKRLPKTTSIYRKFFSEAEAVRSEVYLDKSKYFSAISPFTFSSTA